MLNKTIQSMEKQHSESFYYDIRKQDRTHAYYTLSNVYKAARFLYLNNAGYKGLYRVNKQDQFNVPYGKKENIKFNIDNIKKLSTLFKKVTIQNASFEYTIKNAKKGDFVYFDPPYIPQNITANFVRYTKEGFTVEDHQKLKLQLDNLTKKGVMWMQSNSNTDITKKLYKNYNIQIIDAPRSINNKPTPQKNNEVIITNY